MGIKGLLKELGPLHRKKHLKDFKGLTVGIDAFAWLHRASYGCAKEVCLGLPTSAYIKFCMRILKMLKECEIKPIVVFDGQMLPMKKNEEEKRNRMRRKNYEKAKELMNKGQKKEALDYFKRAIKVTRNMVKNLVESLKRAQIEFVVAPYEADAQLGYLFRKKEIDFCISEDSDLVLFGVNRVLYKVHD